MIQTITGDRNFLESLSGKKATFMLALSHSATANIPGITQAGIPGMIHLTPTLDAEFVVTGEVRSLPNIAETPKGVPTPALMTRAVHLLRPFGHLEMLDLGLKVQPKGEEIVVHRFGIDPSGNIAEGAGIDAKAVYEKGFAFGREFVGEDEYLILGESVPSGTTTATATALALGYEARHLFSSSFKDAPRGIREETIDKALALAEGKKDPFEILGLVSDNMLIFVAGFVLGLNGRLPLILAGGTQMAGALLVTDRIACELGMEVESSRLALATTKWVAQDRHSDIEALLKMPEFSVNAYYADFDFSLSEHPALKLYDEGEAKEGVGAGGALCYGMLNGLEKEAITRQVERFLGA